MPIQVDRCICHYHTVKHLPSFSLCMETAQAFFLFFFFSGDFPKIVSGLVLSVEALIVFSVLQYVISLVHTQCKMLCTQESRPVSLKRETPFCSVPNLTLSCNFTAVWWENCSGIVRYLRYSPVNVNSLHCLLCYQKLGLLNVIFLYYT